MDAEGAAAESRQSNYDDNDDNGEQAAPLLIARGGPLFTPNLVTPLTRIPQFQDSVLSELQGLKDELTTFDNDDGDGDDDDDITVDDLKILSTEELAGKAFKEAFKDQGENNGSAKTRSRKRKRDKLQSSRIDPDDDNYLAIVEELLKIQAKQDEDRSAAATLLHSFNCKVDNASSIENCTVVKSLRSVNSNVQLQQRIAAAQPEGQPLQPDEVVLVVEVYHGVHQWQKTQEFLVLGGQLLTQLKDKIHCKTDEIMRMDGHCDASGYFFIEDVFYNDFREPNGTEDYSGPVFDWLKSSKEEQVHKKWEYVTSGKQKAATLGEFRRAEMQTVRFCDLSFQLGHPYLYCHQGGCKHTVVVRDMRLIHPDDARDGAAYPIESFRLKIRQAKCSVCKIFRATKVTMDDKLAICNPCYFCEDCYYLYHHSKDCSKYGNLLYDDFSVFDYLHD